MHTPEPQQTIPIVGSWKLRSFELRHPSGEVHLPFGQDPHGMIIYTPSGQFSAQLMRNGRPAFHSEDQMDATSQEMASAFSGCISYYGSWKFYDAAGIVMHHVEGSMFPNWEGRSLKRFWAVTGDRMELSTPPITWGGVGTVTGVIQWERISEAQHPLS